MASPENNMSIEEFLGSTFHEEMVEGMGEVMKDFEEGLGKVMAKSLGVFEKSYELSTDAAEENTKAIVQSTDQLSKQVSKERLRATESSNDPSINDKLLEPLLQQAKDIEDQRSKIQLKILKDGYSMSTKQVEALYRNLDLTETQLKENEEQQEAVAGKLEKLTDIETAINESSEKWLDLIIQQQLTQKDMTQDQSESLNQQIEAAKEQITLQEQTLAVETRRLEFEIDQDRRQTKFQKLQAIKDRVVESEGGQVISGVAEQLGLDAILGPLIKAFGPVLNIFAKVQKVVQIIAGFISGSVLLTTGLVAAFGIAIARSENFWKLIKTIGVWLFDMGKKYFSWLIENFDLTREVLVAIFKTAAFFWQSFERGIDSFFGLINMVIEQGTGIFDTFNTALHELADFFKFFIWAPIRSMLDNLGEKFPLLQGVISSVTSVIGGLGNQFSLFINFITESFKLLFEGDIMGIFTNLGNYVKDTFSNIINIYKGVFAGIGTTFVDTLKAIVAKIPGLSKILGISSAQKSNAEENFDAVARARKSPIDDQEKLRLAEERIDAFMVRSKAIEDQLANARDADEKARLEIMATRNRNLIAVQKERISQFQEAEAREKVKQQESNHVTLQPNNGRMEALLAEMSKNVAESNKKDQKIEVRPQYVVSSPTIPSSTSSTLRR
jgi:hypothetical protein